MPTSTDAGTDAAERIERFIAQLVRTLATPHAPPVLVAAPRARTPGRQVAWAFPGSRPDRIRQWGTPPCLPAQFVRVLSYMHGALRSDTVITKRDMYYRDPPLFRTQHAVDTMVTRACLTLALPREALGVCATPRSLVYGPVSLDGSRPETREQLIPDPGPLPVQCEAAWVLVVEKHAIYQTMRSTAFLDLASTYHFPPGALVTGKGYPDYATRTLLSLLLREKKRLRVFFLVDADAHGVDIVRTYLAALDPLSNDRVHWIGLCTQQWMALHMHRTFPALPLRAHDWKKARGLLQNRTLPPRLRYVAALTRHEIAHQLHLGYKCELEALCTPEAVAAHPQRGAMSGELAPFVYTQMRLHWPSLPAWDGS